MEDLRISNRKNNNKNIDNRKKILNFVNFFIKNWAKILIYLALGTILFFPEFTGHLVGDWLNTLITSFISKINF